MTFQDICHQLHRLLEALVRPEFVVRGDTTINLAGWQGKEGPRPDVFVIDPNAGQTPTNTAAARSVAPNW